jgi:predicted DNA-binding transcriptional regulator AlpA
MFTIDEWCQKNRLSRSTFYKLKKVGKAPRLAKVLEAVRITEEADKEWVKAREAEAMAAA